METTVVDVPKSIPTYVALVANCVFSAEGNIDFNDRMFDPGIIKKYFSYSGIICFLMFSTYILATN